MEINNLMKELRNNNIFLTGAGGVGKSYLTTKIIQRYKVLNKNVVVLGSTGIAAANIGGQTLHSFFKIGFSKNLKEYNKFLETTTLAIYKGLTRKLESVIPFIDLLIIDEISMISGDLLDLVEYLLDIYDFKGKIMVVGDFYQLPPVTKDKEEKVYAFESNSWIHRLNFKTIELTKIYRTKDKEFIEVLNNIRKNKLQDNDLDYLNELSCNKDKVKKLSPTILTSTNYEARAYNKIKLDEIKANNHIYKWNLGIFNTGKNEQEKLWWNKSYGKKIVNFCRSLIAEENLEIKVGCQIIFITNNDRWYNGEKGRVIEIKECLKYKDECDVDYIKGVNDEYIEEVLVVEKWNGEIIELYKNKWDLIEYEGNSPSIKKNTIASVFQYPIKLAFALTIHKSQGMSIDNVICDITNIFEEHQFYVSISRAINPNNLYIHYNGDNFRNHIEKICNVNEKVNNFYNKPKGL